MSCSNEDVAVTIDGRKTPAAKRRGHLEHFAAKHPRFWVTLSRFLSPVEHLIKKPLWGCQMCGQCILHETGLTCPMGCPKSMRNGPCGGLGPGGECEVEPTMKCVWLKAHHRDPKLPWKGHIRALQPPLDWSLKGSSSWLNFLSGRDNHVAVEFPRARQRVSDVPRTDGKFEELLNNKNRWIVVGEVNPPDGATVDQFVATGKGLDQIVDVVSVTEHPAARNHMSSVPAAAVLERAGVETICTFTCRDKNRIALQGDILGAAALGIRNVLLVTGNHMVLGDHPNAKPVFDLDSINLLRLVKRLRDEGVYESGRALDAAPQLILGAVAAPFAAPIEDRPARVSKKVSAGADFIITQHVFEIDLFRNFVGRLVDLGLTETTGVLAGIAVLPSPEVAHRLNSVLTGFTIPNETVRRLEQAKDPQATGIEIAVELIQQLQDIPGLRGNLIAALASGSHVMTSGIEEVEITRAVVGEAVKRGDTPVKSPDPAEGRRAT